MKQSNTAILASLLSLTLIGMVMSTSAFSQDYEREAKHAENIEEMLIVGDPVYLNSAAEPEHEFINLLTTSEDSNSNAAVIIVHGSGIHPNWPDLIHPLRATLPEHGYTTFAVQMPVPPMEAEYDAYPPLLPLARGRLQAAQTYLSEQGYQPIYIIAHSMGAAMTTWSLVQPSDDDVGTIHSIDGLILVGSADLREFDVDNLQAINRLTMPVVDIYGSDDLPAVMQSNDYRAEQGHQLKSFSQLEISGANHMFSTDNTIEVLTEKILEILKTWQSSSSRNG